MYNNSELSKNLIEAWKRYINRTNTDEDIALIFDSIKDKVYNREFKEVFNEAWDKAMNELPSTSEERKEIYRQEFAHYFAEYENRQRMLKRQANQKRSQTTTSRFLKIFYRVAAVFLLCLMIPVAYLYLKPKTEQSVVRYVETFTRRGEIKTVLLPDRTEVTLNAGSRIKYPENFTDDERSIELYGEAVFNVTSDPTRPFTVKTENMNVKVVGTVFNVKAYSDDLVSSVSVVSGKVEVGLNDGKVMLEPNRQLKMDKATGNIETMTIDAGNYLSWMNGKLYFYRTPIREVVNILNRHYPDIDVVLAAGEYANVISGEHDNMNAEELLKHIVDVSGLKCKKTGKKYTLFN